MLTIHYQPHKSRVREAEFFQTLRTRFPDAAIVHESYRVEPEYLERLVDTGRLISWLQADELLANTRRRRCIKILKDCPDQLKVALTPSRVSFDIVIVEDQKPYYWEFQEEQHWKLKVSRRKKVFAPDGTPIEVPPYLQRLVRDVWRALYFRPYTIVWWDWFAVNRAVYSPSLSKGFREFHNNGKFSFRAFCRISD